MNTADVIVIGAGLSGLTASLELALAGYAVTVVERHAFPRHKVCGEYLSLEVEPYLLSRGIDLADARRIQTFELSATSGRPVRIPLPLGGLGISRYALDLRLYNAALEAGVHFHFEKALGIEEMKDSFRVTTTKSERHARMVIGAWGKRSSLDRAAGRDFWRHPTPWMAVKAHYRDAQYREDQVGLYVFKDGYAGCSLTEKGHLNLCYLVRKNRFKEAGNPEACTEELLGEHPRLHQILQGAHPVFERPLSISEISFRPKKLHSGSMLFTGDAARLIHPLCGNGMAMAIVSGRLAAGKVSKYLEGGISRPEDLYKAYRAEWRKQFSWRLGWGSALQSIVTRPRGLETAVRIAGVWPGILRQAVRQTHGKPHSLETI